VKNNRYLADFKEKFQQYSIIEAKFISEVDVERSWGFKERLDLLQRCAKSKHLHRLISM
jgi:hypothetical protein